MLGAIQILYIQQFLYVLSLTVYSINMEKKSHLWKRKKNECVFWITLRTISYLIYSYFMCFMEEKKSMKFLRKHKFSVMPEIF